MLKTIVILMLLAVSPAAMAYIGPGAGISVLGSLLGILGTIVVAIGAIIFWPIRKFLKRKKQAKATAGEESASEND
jgi:protein-S-isoprenylcysteine O-methyltransferase Ste14